MDILNRLEITQALLIGLVLTGLYYFLFFNNGAPILQQTEAVRKEYQDQQVILEKIRKALADQARFAQEVEEINTNLESFLNYFPVDTESNELMTKVEQAIEASQATRNSIQPNTVAPEFPDYTEKTFAFEVEGTFNQIMQFVANLTQLKRAIDFKATKIRVKTAGENPTLEFKSTLVIFGRKPEEGKK